MCRYVTACGATAADAPNASTTTGASGQPTAMTTAPMNAASQTPSTPWRIASRRFPAPICRATDAVVPYARKTHTLTNVDRI